MKIRIAPSVLRSIRTNKNIPLADVALRTKIPESDLEAWELENLEIEIEDLKKLAKIYHRNWIGFLASTPEPPLDVDVDRRVGVRGRVSLNPDTIQAFEDAEYLLGVSDDLEFEFKVKLPQLPKMGPAKLAENIRPVLGISVNQQKEQQTKASALYAWINAVNEIGIYVIQKPLKDESLRAFSKTTGKRAVIVLNTNEPPGARTFSLMHELCHVYLNDSGLCGFYEADTGRFSDREVYCNRFAASLLLPADSIKSDFNFQQLKPGDHNTKLVAKIAKDYQVTELAVYRRLVDFDIISYHQYLQIHVMRVEAYKLGSEKEEGRSGGTYYGNLFRKTSVPFIENVIGAYSDGRIGFKDIGSLLEINTKLIPTVREKLRQLRD